MFDAKPEDRSALAVVVFPDSFWTEHVELPDGTLKSVDRAKWGKRGYANHETSEAVPRLIAAAKANRERPDPTLTVWDALEPHYKRWKEAGRAASPRARSRPARRCTSTRSRTWRASPMTCCRSSAWALSACVRMRGPLLRP